MTHCQLYTNYENIKQLECVAPQEIQFIYPPQERSSEIPRGRGLLKVKILEAKYEAKLEFPRGGSRDAKQKPSPSAEGVWIFSGTAQFRQQ